MVQTTISTQTKVAVAVSAAIVTGLAAYGLGYVPDVSISLDSDENNQVQIASSDGGEGAGFESVNSLIEAPGLSMITSPTLPNAITGVPYETRLKANSDGMVRWHIAQGALPAGLTLDESGVIRGTAVDVGTFSFIIKYAEVSGERSGSSVFALTTTGVAVTSGIQHTITIRTTTLPEGRVGTAYQTQLSADGMLSEYNWTQENSAMPAGLLLTTDGFIKGTPTQAGTFSLRGIKVTALMNPAVFATVDLTLIVKGDSVSVATNPTVPVSTVTETLQLSGGFPDGTIGQYYDAGAPIGLGGRPPYSWTVTAGNIPPGLYFSNDGRLTGYPNQYGIYTFTVQVRDQNGLTASIQRSIQIRPTQPIINNFNTNDSDLSNRLRQLDFIGVQVHDLIKLQDDGNPYTQNDTTVYYIGADGRRHFFPNPHVYFSWFPDYSRVRIIAVREMGQIPLGANVTYRPSVRLVKFKTDPKVYAVSNNRQLRWLTNESAAIGLYGPFWMRQVDDISDDFYSDYLIGAPINNANDYSVSGMLGTARYPSDVLPR